MTAEPEIREGQTWRHRYDSYRTLVVDHVREEHGETMVETAFPVDLYAGQSSRRKCVNCKRPIGEVGG